MESNSDNVISIRRGVFPPMGEIWNFSYPHEVVGDESLSVEDKRSILAAWASNTCRKSFPALRHLPGTPFPVTFSSIMNARAALDSMSDRDDDDPPPTPHAMRSSRIRVPLREAA